MKTLELFCLILRYIMFYFVDKNESGYQDICEEANIAGYGTICYYSESEILTYETSDDTANKIKCKLPEEIMDKLHHNGTLICRLNELKPKIQKAITMLYKSKGIRVLGKANIMFKAHGFMLFPEYEWELDFIPKFSYEGLKFNRKNITDFIQD